MYVILPVLIKLQNTWDTVLFSDVSQTIETGGMKYRCSYTVAEKRYRLSWQCARKKKLRHFQVKWLQIETWNPIWICTSRVCVLIWKILA